MTSFPTIHKIKSNEIPTAVEAVLDSKWNDELKLSIEEDIEWTFPEGGFKAWSIVFACACLSGISMGSGLLFGTWIQELHAFTYPDTPLSTLNFIGGAMNLSSTISSFFSGRLGDKYGYKPVLLVGCTLSVISFVVSAFTYDHLPLIFIFQGAFVGISLGIAMPVFLSLPSQYFLRRRGLATGFAASGSGFFGGITSLILKGLLPKFGYRNTMLIYAAMNTVVFIVSYLLIEVRLPPLKEGESRVPKKWLPDGVYSDPAFYSLGACIALGLFGYLTPFYYISIYTTITVPWIESKSVASTLPLVLSNFAGGFGRIFAGILSDRIGPINSLFLSFFLGGLLQVLVWPFCKNYGSIITFSILYGLVGSPFLSLLPVAASSLFGLKGLATIVGFVFLLTSPGQLSGSAISGVVLTSTGGDYTKMAAYSGSMMMAGGLAILPARYSRTKNFKFWVKI